MIVVGIDLSLTNTGVAILRDGQVPKLFSDGHKGHDSDSWLQRSRRIVSQSRWTTGVVKAHLPIDLAVIEAPLIAGPNNGKAFDRAGLFHGVYAQLTHWGIPIAMVHQATRSKWATGKATGDKKAVLAAVRDDWQVYVRDDDQADALTLAGMGALHLGEPLPIPVPEWRINGLKSVTWPEVVGA